MANTQRAYAGDWRRFPTWYCEHGREALPADVFTMVALVTTVKLNEANDAEIMNQTKHKTIDMLRRYTRLDNIRQHTAAQKLAL